MSLNVAYGIDVQSVDHPVVLTVEKAMEALAIAGSPGAFLVDTIPICGSSCISLTLYSPIYFSEIRPELGPRSWIPEDGTVLSQMCQ